MKPNANIQKELDHLDEQHDKGLAAGYDNALAPLPDWYYELPLVRLTTWQRAYWLGRELRLIELKGNDDE